MKKKWKNIKDMIIVLLVMYGITAFVAWIGIADDSGLAKFVAIVSGIFSIALTIRFIVPIKKDK